MTFDWVIVGGLLSGALAGGAARFGRLCTMSAIEDALIGHDYRGLKAWGLALAVAITATQAGFALGILDLERNAYTGPHIHVLGAALGGLVFGLGMTLAGTCSFGLIVRAGGGDLRAVVTAAVIGVFAFAFTAGILAPLRNLLLGVGTLDVTSSSTSAVDVLLSRPLGSIAARTVLACLPLGLAVLAFGDRRLRKRPRLLLGATGLGLSIAMGWWTTTRAVDTMMLDRVESLSFVAPVGRALLQFMTVPFRNVEFGVAAMIGAAIASFVVAAWRREFRWEAFDDAREMRRQMFGAALMGLGGVLAQGCTIGQGLSAASVLAVSAPIFMMFVIAGAWLGLRHLIEGASMWRLGFSQHTK